MEEQRELRWTALDVFKAVSEHIPDGITLTSIDFTESRNSQGNNIVLRGTLDSDITDSKALQDYSDALADEVTDNGRPLFSQIIPPNITQNTTGYLTWYVVCILKREGVEK